MVGLPTVVLYDSRARGAALHGFRICLAVSSSHPSRELTPGPVAEVGFERSTDALP